MQKCLPFVIVVVLGGCVHAPKSKFPSRQEDLTMVLSKFKATSQNMQADGSAISCVEFVRWSGTLVAAIRVAQLKASAMILHAAKSHVERTQRDGEVREMRTRTWSSGTLRKNRFAQQWGRRWVCVKTSSVKVDSH